MQNMCRFVVVCAALRIFGSGGVPLAKNHYLYRVYDAPRGADERACRYCERGFEIAASGFAPSRNDALFVIANDVKQSRNGRADCRAPQWQA
ncbi:hypothetical protein LJC45_01825 [Alistipes sp. OttesenSCG-928-B03]|nr:hypothetical protein [Alistipes sp. OttesenSCG-928-B03]